MNPETSDSLDGGLVLYEGPTQIPGQRGNVALIVTGIGGKNRTRNRKTGDEPQAWIIPIDQGEMNAAVRDGREGSACGECIHRPALGGACYVTIAWGPQRVWYTYAHDRYSRPSVAAVQEALRGGSIRWGAWGDPAAIPVEVYRPYLDVLDCWQGYTQQWGHLDVNEWGWLMASVNNPEEAAVASAKGWRYFRVRADAHDPLRPEELVCPASAEAEYRLTCLVCRQCDGLRRKGRKRPSVAIVAHGYRRGAIRQLRQYKLPFGEDP